MSFQFNNKLPIYIQLMHEIKKQIVSGKLVPDQQVPTVRDMASTYGVNPNTVQRALQELETEGILKSEATTGRFIQCSDDKISELRYSMAKSEVSSYHKNMNDLGFSNQQIIDYTTTYCQEETYEQ